MKAIVVAYDKNMGIGDHSDLPWQRALPADQRYFKELTTGHAVIMGRKTYESIGRLLPNRQNIIISRQSEIVEGAIVVDSLDAAYDAVDPDKDTFVIGGGQVYKTALNSVDRIYATEVDGSFEADVCFPDINVKDWVESSRVHNEADERNKYNFDFVVYDHR